MIDTWFEKDLEKNFEKHPVAVFNIKRAKI